MKGKPKFKVVEIHEQVIFDLVYANLTLARILDECVPGCDFSPHAVEELSRHQITLVLAMRVFDERACEMFMARRAAEAREQMELNLVGEQLAKSQRRRQRPKTPLAPATPSDPQARESEAPPPASFELSPPIAEEPAAPSSKTPAKRSRPSQPKLSRRQRR